MKKWKEGLMDSFPNDTYGKKELKIVNEPDYPKTNSNIVPFWLPPD